MKLYSAQTINEIKDRHNFKLSKSLGQNFLTDKNIIDEIIESSGISSLPQPARTPMGRTAASSSAIQRFFMILPPIGLRRSAAAMTTSYLFRARLSRIHLSCGGIWHIMNIENREERA